MSIASVLFDHKSRKSGCISIDTNLAGEIDGESSVVSGLAIDTEFRQPAYDPTTTTQLEARKGVTLQMRGVSERLEDAVILVYPEQVAYCEMEGLPIRHPTFKHGFAGADFLEHHGYHVQLERYTNFLATEKLPTIQFVLYAHFALAEVGMMAQGEYLEDIYSAMRHNHISFHRRLQTSHTVKRKKSEHSQHKDFIPMVGWRLTVNGCPYNAELCIVDSVAVHGPASYKNLCANVGIQLSQKDEMHSSGYISKMHEAYNAIAEIFDTYATEDLMVEKALRAWCKLVGDVYQLFGVSAYYRGEPRMTIGATAKDLLEAVLYRGVGLKPGDKEALETFVENCLTPATAKTLIDQVVRSRCLLAKVDGGRCRSNQSALAHVLGVLADIDIKSCYGEGLRCQLLPIGRPMILDYPIDNPLHRCKTLRQFLTEVGYNRPYNQLVYGLWHARVSTPEGYRLQYPQDYLQSWVNYSLRDMRDLVWHKNLEDLDDVEAGLDVKSGSTKVFTHEVRDACITSDFLDWLFYVCGPAQREELLDQLYIKAAMVYPKCEQRNSPAEVFEAQANPSKGSSSSFGFTYDASQTTNVDAQSYAWYGFNLGELMIDRLLQERGMHPKKTDVALNNLYKLLINSTFGDLTSPYFTVANPTVGNNITARGRSMAWYAEKGLNAFQTITDGGAFDLNRVVFPYQQQKIAAYKFVGLHRSGNVRHDHGIQYGSLGGNPLTLTWEKQDKSNIPLLTIAPGQVLRGMDAHHWIEARAMEHLQCVFPDNRIRVLHRPSTRLTFDNDEKPTSFEYTERTGLYSFELKACYDEMTLHGPANYAVFQDGTMIDRAQRSYPRKKEYVTAILQGGELARGHLYDDADPAIVLHEALRNPTHVPRQEVFVKSGILMPSEWRHAETSTWLNSPLKPGDSYWKAGLLREASMSQFTYQSKDQWEAWEKVGNKLRTKYGQSFEAFFLNPDGTLNHEKMIRDLDGLIANGITDPLEWFDPSRHKTRDYDMRHPALDALEAVKRHLRWWQGLDDNADVVHDPTDDTHYALPRDEYHA